jgi:hypothetical protein
MRHHHLPSRAAPQLFEIFFLPQMGILNHYLPPSPPLSLKFSKSQLDQTNSQQIGNWKTLEEECEKDWKNSQQKCEILTNMRFSECEKDWENSQQECEVLENVRERLKNLQQKCEILKNERKTGKVLNKNVRFSQM